MIFGKTKMELKVGVFVFIGLVILAMFVLSIGRFKTWTSGYRVNFTFGFINGVRMGAPVRFAGLDVGEVKQLKLFFAPGESKTRVNVQCWLRREVRIPEDSQVWINTLGLLGEKYIEIMPGHDYSRCMQQNESLVGVDPLTIHEITRLAKSIADNLDVTFNRIRNQEGTIGKLLYDDTLYNELEAFAKDIRRNPWKLFFKTKEIKADSEEKKDTKGQGHEERMHNPKQNFSPR